MARQRTRTPEDRAFEPEGPRADDDPRTDPAPGFRYDAIERRRPTYQRLSTTLGIATVLLVAALVVLILVI